MPAGELYRAELGEGDPIVVLHGGPDFDSEYLRPELDRLAESFRLVYYDQRGRGRSAEGVRPEDVTLASELEDLDRVRGDLGFESVAVLGHSWGGVLAMEYALRRAGRVSHLILLNTGAASSGDWRLLRQALARRRPPGELEAIAATEAYKRGELAAEAAYYRIHFASTVPPELLDTLVARLRTNFDEEGVLLARAIEHRLYDETSGRASWDLLPALRRLDVPTLVIHGEHDFVPVELVARIADAVTGARLSVLPGCGHFTYLEAPERVAAEVAGFC